MKLISEQVLIPVVAPSRNRRRRRATSTCPWTPQGADVTAGVDIGFDVLWFLCCIYRVSYVSCKFLQMTNMMKRKSCTKIIQKLLHCLQTFFAKISSISSPPFWPRVGTELFRPQGFGNLEKLENAKPCRNFAHLPGECHKEETTAEQRNYEVIWFYCQRLVENST